MPGRTGRNLPRQKPGEPIAARTINRTAAEAERSSRFGIGPSLALMPLPGGDVVRPIGAADAMYIQLTGTANATFGSYPWREVQRRECLYLSGVGSGYTTAAVSFSVAGTGAVAPTATIDVLANGKLSRPNVVTPGSKMTSCSATVTGDGTGATLACILDQGQLLAGGWVPTGLVGAVGPDDANGHPTPGDLAYEADGVLGLAADGAVYSAVRDGATGQLLFFSSRTYLAKTYTITTYPTGANAWYACHPVLMSGIPTEGGTPSLSDSSALMFAYNLGATVPPNGTYVKISEINGTTGPYFVMRYT